LIIGRVTAGRTRGCGRPSSSPERCDRRRRSPLGQIDLAGTTEVRARQPGRRIEGDEPGVDGAEEDATATPGVGASRDVERVETPRDVASTTRRVRSTFASQAQRSFPVSASRAITRLYGVLKKSVPSTMSGVASKAS